MTEKGTYLNAYLDPADKHAGRRVAVYPLDVIVQILGYLPRFMRGIQASRSSVPTLTEKGAYLNDHREAMVLKILLNNG